VPYDLLIDDCDIIIAIDVMGQSSAQTHRLPSFFDAIFNTVHIMQQSILVRKIRNYRPDIYIKPDITDIRMLEFY
jgi:NTE family protein